MIRTPYAIYPDTVVNFTLYDPIIIKGVLAVNTDEGDGRIKVGDGINTWSNLSYVGGSTIGAANVTTDAPDNNEILRYSDYHGELVYTLHGMSDIETNWLTNNDVFPTFAILVELDDVTDEMTGRIKISDGVTTQDQIPWIWFNYDEWPTGYCVYYNGTTIDFASYQPYNTLEFATTPLGKFHRDDGTWAFPSIFTDVESIETDLLETTDLYVFGTITLGGFPTEPTSVTITTDGVDAFIDGNRVWTQYNDGIGSGLDADTLDGHHVETFLLLESSGESNNVCIFGTTGNDVIDSGYSISNFIVQNFYTYKGIIDCSSNPLFPTAEVGDFYKVSASGLIGGEFGTAVIIGNDLICNTATSGGEFASVGLSWDIIDNTTLNTVIGPVSSINEHIVVFDGTTGQIIKDSGYTMSSFATASDLEMSDENALIYSIVMGG